VAEAMELLRTAGVEAPDRMLGPLLSAALDNALRSGDAALTGPVVRGDAGTIAAHLEALETGGVDGATQAYRALARVTAVRALAAGRLKAGQADALLAALADPA